MRPDRPIVAPVAFQTARYFFPAGPRHLVSRVRQSPGIFALLGENEVFIGDMIAAELGDPGHASRSANQWPIRAKDIQALEAILEQEMNAVVLSCTRARRQLLAETRGSRPTVH
jgi:hypothetical protein